jgi:hypothetical protein
MYGVRPSPRSAHLLVNGRLRINPQASKPCQQIAHEHARMGLTLTNPSLKPDYFHSEARGFGPKLACVKNDSFPDPQPYALFKFSLRPLLG